MTLISAPSPGGLTPTNDSVRSNKGNDEFKEFLTSPMKWFRSDQQMPALAEASPLSPDGDSSNDLSEESAGDHSVMVEDRYDVAVPKNDDSSSNQKLKLTKLDFGPLKDFANLFSPQKQQQQQQKQQQQQQQQQQSTLRTLRTLSSPLPPPVVPVVSSAPVTAAAPIVQQEQNEEPVNHFAPLLAVVTMFSPKKPQQPQETTQSSTLTLATPQNGAPKRLDFHEEVVERAPESADVPSSSTNYSLYDTAKTRAVAFAQSAKQTDPKQWVAKAKQLDPKKLAFRVQQNVQDLVTKAHTSTTRHARNAMDAAKEVKPGVVLREVQLQTKELTANAHESARAHPLPWMVIIVVSICALITLVAGGGSTGTPTTQWWQFGVQMTPPQGRPSQIVDRVGAFVNGQLEEEMEPSVQEWSCDRSEALIAHLSQTLAEDHSYKKDWIDFAQERFQDVRSNPRQYWERTVQISKSFVTNVHSRGRQLSSEAFDNATFL